MPHTATAYSHEEYGQTRRYCSDDTGRQHPHDLPNQWRSARYHRQACLARQERCWPGGRALTTDPHTPSTAPLEEGRAGVGARSMGREAAITPQTAPSPRHDPGSCCCLLPRAIPPDPVPGSPARLSPNGPRQRQGGSQKRAMRSAPPTCARHGTCVSLGGRGRPP